MTSAAGLNSPASLQGNIKIYYMCYILGEVLVEAGVGNGEDRDGAVTDDGDAAAGLSYTERFFVGFVSGVIIVVCVICYLHCRKGAVESLELSKPSPAVYSVVSSDDVERGCMSLELSSRGSRGSSGEDEQDAQNWDDWEQENSKDESRGEFIQYSNYVNVATTVSAPPILAAVRANTSSGSLGKLSSRSISPSVSKRRSSARDSRQQKSSPIGDDLFAVCSVYHYISAGVICDLTKTYCEYSPSEYLLLQPSKRRPRLHLYLLLPA